MSHPSPLPPARPIPTIEEQQANAILEESVRRRMPEMSPEQVAAMEAASARKIGFTPEHQARAGIPYDPTGPAVDEHINSRCACGAKLATQCDFGTCESPLITSGHVLTPSEALMRNRRVVRVLLLIVVLLFAALCVTVSFLIARPAHSLPEDSAPQHEYRKPIRVGPGGGAPPSQWR